MRQSATWHFVAPLLLLAGCAESAPEERTSRIRVFTVAAPAAANGDCARLSWPVDGPLSSPFGERDGKRHEGIDLSVPTGTPVHAACDGIVAYAGDRLRGYGRLVIVQHAPPLVTVYAHNSELEVKEGDRVTRGQELARSGATGHVTAPHVHFEVRRDNRPDDPLKYLPPRAQLQARRGETNGPTSRIAHRPRP